MNSDAADAATPGRSLEMRDDAQPFRVPKTAELGAAVVAFVSGGQAPERLAQQLTWSPFLTTGAFGIVCIALASWLFTRKEF